MPPNITEEGRPELCCGPDFILHVMYEYFVCVCVCVCECTHVYKCVYMYACMYMCLLLRVAANVQNIFS